MKLELTELFIVPGPIHHEKYIMVMNDSWEFEVSKQTYHELEKRMNKNE